MEQDISRLVPGVRYVDLETDRGNPMRPLSPAQLQQLQARQAAAAAASAPVAGQVVTDPGAEGDHLADLVGWGWGWGGGVKGGGDGVGGDGVGGGGVEGDGVGGGGKKGSCALLRSPEQANWRHVMHPTPPRRHHTPSSPPPTRRRPDAPQKVYYPLGSLTSFESMDDTGEWIVKGGGLPTGLALDLDAQQLKEQQQQELEQRPEQQQQQQQEQEEEQQQRLGGAEPVGSGGAANGAGVK